MQICYGKPDCKNCQEIALDLPTIIINTNKTKIDNFLFFLSEYKLKTFLAGEGDFPSFFEHLTNSYNGLIFKRQSEFEIELKNLIDEKHRLCDLNRNFAFANIHLSDKPIILRLKNTQKEVNFVIMRGEEEYMFVGDFCYAKTQDGQFAIFCN